MKIKNNVVFTVVDMPHKVAIDVQGRHEKRLSLPVDSHDLTSLSDIELFHSSENLFSTPYIEISMRYPCDRIRKVKFNDEFFNAILS